MPSIDRSDGLWVDEMDGPERLERAKKRRFEQLKRWEVRESTSNYEPESKRSHRRTVNFVPNIVMLEAAARNDLDEVARLLESGVSPDLANEDGLTALHQSCIDGCDDMVKYLIEHKANVNACDNEQWTPLHAAAACGHLSIIKYLLKNGGNILALNLDGNLPVGVVEDDKEVEKFLDKEMLKLGYDEAAIEELRLNEGKELLDDLKDSVAKGRSLDLQDEDGATAFHVAAANGWTNVVDFLLENEADFDIADNDGWQPIHAAAAWGHDTIIESLVASGADLDSKTNDSRTPLDLTEETEIIELIEELKTKEVKYPRKGKGVRRKRSNTCNSSIKRTSIHEKCVLSQTDTKAEGAALFMKLQSTEDTKASSPADEPVNNTPAETLDGERQSTSSRDENNSSGYVSEGGQSDNRTEEKHEPLKTSDISEKVEEKKAETKVEDTENKDTNNLKVETQNKTSSIKQSPVPKPPRLGTLNSASRLDPQAYINFEITPLEKNLKTPSNKPEADIKQDLSNTQSEKPEADIKQDLSNTQSENLKPNKPVQNTEVKTSSDENAKKEQNTEPLERLTTSTLPKLATTDKRKAPEPPEVTANTKHAPLSKKGSKKDPASEVQKVPTKNAVSYSNSAAAKTTASPTNESKDEEKLLASKSSGRGFAFPRSRKTCCSVM